MALSSAGIESIHVVFEDVNGQVIGGGLSLAESGVSAAYNLLGVEDFNYAIPDSNIEQVRGDNGALFAFTFPPSDIPTGDASFAVSDPSKAVEMRGSSSVIMYGGQAAANAGYIVNPNAFNQRNAWIITHQPAKNADLASFGNAGYAISFYRVNMLYRGQQGMSLQSPTSYSYTITGVQGSKMFWGETYASRTSNKVTLGGGHADHFNQYPIIPVIVRGNSTPINTFTIPSGLAIAPSDTPVRVYLDGTELTLAASAGAVTTGEYHYESSTDLVTLDSGALDADNYAVALVEVTSLRNS